MNVRYTTLIAAATFGLAGSALAQNTPPSACSNPPLGTFCLEDSAKPPNFVGAASIGSDTVARQFNGESYSFRANRLPASIPGSGVAKGQATFIYPTSDCSGNAYLQDFGDLIPLISADNNGVLWGAGSPTITFTINSQCQPNAAGGTNCSKKLGTPGGACEIFHAGAPVAAGIATVIDSGFVNNLVPPLRLSTDPLGN